MSLVFSMSLTGVWLTWDGHIHPSYSHEIEMIVEEWQRSPQEVVLDVRDPSGQ